ncbi:50S ribosomal protein L24 [Dehalobacterium formicoaceticum]|uniref:Large ribosomal subunit protein uL24 n=1 Tax=Dehalobacterium formicoaceticum TaxID=51515 RepID=A0ABT1XZC4_9FIRM|nr:50S ribosomal protein L24 [Dehalobacterium formicoaceticum]MCR6543965.1 50S ribosomal protein L24 [Dehalobacterium formicoaceticum]
MANQKVHVKKGDQVLVITGKDAGKKGKVLAVEPKNSRVFVEGINIVKRHTKPTQASPQGGIREKEAAVASSNVMLLCPRCSKPTRISKKLMPNGTLARQCKRCGEVIEK